MTTTSFGRNQSHIFSLAFNFSASLPPKSLNSFESVYLIVSSYGVSCFFSGTFASYDISYFAGTKNIINLCIKYNVSRLIYTSSASVTLTPYLGKAPFAVVINQTESKIKPATSDSSLIIPGYSVTKLRAERIVLGAHETNLANGSGKSSVRRQI